ncbi:hypothetical protein DPMN_000175 [Dreissena polymorpha]|uniref:Uncharacterized protein n=1 Tax=Dreissena polymorpha TaxID=45954 RepID=A0A9D4MHI4_DREPO|nr:hypothetical protein DPMN_000175 [Dreissena polymorpha]
MRVRLSREASAVGDSGRGRMPARAGFDPRGVCALVRGGVLCTLGTATRSYCLLRLTDGREQLTNPPTSAPDKHTTTTYYIL